MRLDDLLQSDVGYDVARHEHKVRVEDISIIHEPQGLACRTTRTRAEALDAQSRQMCERLSASHIEIRSTCKSERASQASILDVLDDGLGVRVAEDEDVRDARGSEELDRVVDDRHVDERKHRLQYQHMSIVVDHDR